MEIIKLAQIGCGYWGINLLRNFNNIETCELKYIVEPSIERQIFLNQNFPHISVISDLKKVLEDETIQGVIISTPASSHYFLAKQCLENNKNVFIEKPFTTNLEHALDLKNLAQKRNLVLMAGHTYLYNSAINEIKKIMPQLGKPLYATMNRLNLGIIRSDVNVWWNLAPHDVSILLFLLNNKKPEYITVFGKCFLQNNIEDLTKAVLEWDDGFTAYINLSWLSPDKVRKMTLVGTNKMIIFDDIASKDKILVSDSVKNISDNKNSPKFKYDERNYFYPSFPIVEPLKIEAKHFVDCIEKKIECLTGADHAIDVVSILESGQKSLENNGSKEFIKDLELA
jgi:predicted dehydrogenase